MKKQPQRMCVACRHMKDKNQLVRVVKTSQDILLDMSGKLEGRGCYVCKDMQCMQKLVKNKLLNKAFKMDIPKEVYNKIEEFDVGQNGINQN